MTLIMHAAFFYDCGNGQIRMAEKLRAFFHPLFQQIFLPGITGFRLEQMQKARLAQIHFRSHLTARKRLFQTTLQNDKRMTDAGV